MTTTQTTKNTKNTKKTAKNTKTTAQAPAAAALPVGRFCWLALRTPDVAKARAFYGHVVGWSFDPGNPQMPMATFSGKNGPVAHVEVVANRASFGSYVVVADLGAAVKRAVAAGGRVAGDVVTIPGIGAMREVEDGDGAAFSLFQPESAEQAQRVSGPGAFLWNELHARDEKAATAFLTAVVGYSVDVMPFAGMEYRVLKSKDGAAKESLAGVMKTMNPQAPSQWVPYLHVDDVDAARARAVDNGATALGDAVSADGIGRFAVLVDPQGAVFAVMTPAAV